MKLIYRGMTSERHPSQTFGRLFVPVGESIAVNRHRYRGVTDCIDSQTKTTQVPAKLVSHKLIYRGITFSVNRSI